MSDIQLWVAAKPFYFGVIQTHPKISKAYLEKVLTYARSKGPDGGFPKLRWSIWKHMAMNKMLLHENYALAYFEAYLNLKECTRDERLEEAELLQQSYEDGNLDTYLSGIEVDTFEFVLHLYLQQASKISLRTSLLGDEWPGSSPRRMTSSPDLDSSKTSSIPNIFDEGHQLSFVLTNLTEILELLSASGDRGGQRKPERRLSLDAVRSLGFIIKAYVPKLRNEVPLHTLAVRHRYQNKSGFSRSTNDFSCRTFENWLRSSLGQNPYGLSECLSSGTKLRWTVPKKSKGSVRKRSQIVSNAKSDGGGANKLVYFSNCLYQTIAQQSPILDDSFVKISKSNGSHFYLLSPLQFVSIEKCNDSMFVLGPVAVCVRVSGCHNITVIAPCRSIVIGSSRNVTAHVATSTRPILIGEAVSSQRLGSGDALPMATLAPYHTYYGQLEQHLAQLGLVISPQMNQWNNPISLSHELLPKGKGEAKSLRRRTEGSVDSEPKAVEELYRILPLSEFFSFSVPFDTVNDTSDFLPTTIIPWPLPKEYARSLDEKQRAVTKYKSAVRTAKMSAEEKKEFQTVVEKNFKEWLETTGNKRQLDDLADMTKFFDDD